MNTKKRAPRALLRRPPNRRAAVHRQGRKRSKLRGKRAHRRKERKLQSTGNPPASLRQPTKRFGYALILLLRDATDLICRATRVRTGWKRSDSSFPKSGRADYGNDSISGTQSRTRCK